MNDRITITIEGIDPPDKRVRVTDFIRELQLLLGSLHEIESQMRPLDTQSLYYHIVDLRYGSPAVVAIEAVPTDGTKDLSHQVITKFRSVVHHVESAEPLREKLSLGLLERLAGMAAPVGKTLSSVRILAGTDNFLFGEDFRKNVVELLRPEETYPGYVRGMLEAINLHGGVNIFRIYPDVGPAKVTCQFPNELEGAAIQAIGRFVEVRGTLGYKVTASFPHEISVCELEALPEERELPTLGELRGVVPSATGSQSSEAFVRGIRNAVD